MARDIKDVLIILGEYAEKHNTTLLDALEGWDEPMDPNLYEQVKAFLTETEKPNCKNQKEVSNEF